MRYSPAGCAVKRSVSVASDTIPSLSLSVNARGIAGATGCVGSGVCGAMISALCGSIPSWLRKSISVRQPAGTTSVSPPSRKPLKLSAPFRPVSPAISWKRTVFAGASKLSQVGSISGPRPTVEVVQSATSTAGAYEKLRAVMRECSVLQRNQAGLPQRRKGALYGDAVHIQVVHGAAELTARGVEPLAAGPLPSRAQRREPNGDRSAGALPHRPDQTVALEQQDQLPQLVVQRQRLLSPRELGEQVERRGGQAQLRERLRETSCYRMCSAEQLEQ